MRKRIFAKLPSAFEFATFIFVALLYAGPGIVMSSQPALAQSNDVIALQNQLNSLRQAIKDLQIKVFRGQTHENTNLESNGGVVPSQAQVSQVQAQVFELDETLRDLIGQYEVLDNRARRIEARLDKLIEDIDFRLTALENSTFENPTFNQASAIGQETSTLDIGANQTATSLQSTTVISSAGTMTNTPSTDTPSAFSQANRLATLAEQQLQNFEAGQGVVLLQDQGQNQVNAPLVPENSVAVIETLPASPGADISDVAPPYATVEEEYEAAYDFVKKHDLDAAERALKGFIDRYPDHALVGNAMYWLGETHYARKQYGEAMSNFAATYEHDEKGRKAPDSLLKLGMSLAQLGETDQSCVTYNVLLSKHADANQVVLRKAQQRKQVQNCPE